MHSAHNIYLFALFLFNLAIIIHYAERMYTRADTSFTKNASPCFLKRYESFCIQFVNSESLIRIPFWWKCRIKKNIIGGDGNSHDTTLATVLPSFSKFSLVSLCFRGFPISLTRKSLLSLAIKHSARFAEISLRNLHLALHGKRYSAIISCSFLSRLIITTKYGFVIQMYATNVAQRAQFHKWIG